MNEVKVLSTRAAEYLEEGMACGPVAMDVVCAEAVVQDGDAKKYITVCYVSEASDVLECDITDEPIFDFMTQDVEEKDIELLDKIRDNGEQFTLEEEGDYDGSYLEIIKLLCRKLYDTALEAGTISEDNFDYADNGYSWIKDYAGVKLDIPTFDEFQASEKEKYGLNAPMIPFDESKIIAENQRKVILDDDEPVYIATMKIEGISCTLIAEKFHENDIEFYLKETDPMEDLNSKFPDSDKTIEYWEYIETVNAREGYAFYGHDDRDADNCTYTQYFNRLGETIKKMM